MRSCVPITPFNKSISYEASDNFRSRPYLNCFEQDEEFLVNALAKDHLRPPSILPYNFSVPVEEVDTWGQYGQPAYIDEVFFKGQVLADHISIRIVACAKPPSCLTIDYQLNY